MPDTFHVVDVDAEVARWMALHADDIAASGEDPELWRADSHAMVQFLADNPPTQDEAGNYDAGPFLQKAAEHWGLTFEETLDIVRPYLLIEEVPD